MGKGGSSIEVLRVPDARALISASAASQLGDWLYNAALLGYVYSATGSAGWVGAATIARLLPFVLLGPLGGTIADRYVRRTVLLAGDLLRFLTMLVLAAIVAADGPVVAVIATTMLASAAGCAEKPAAMAMLPRLVGELRIGAANALLHTVQALGIVAGPALGAVLLAVAPSWAAFLVNAGTFALSALLISTIRQRDTPVAQAAGTGAQLRQGLRILREVPQVAWLMVVVAMVELTYGAQTVQLVVYAREELDLGAGGYGILLAAIGTGGVLSTAFSGRLAAGRRATRTVVVAAAVTCASQLAFAGSADVALAVAIAVTAGVAIVTCEVVAETALVSLVPEDKLGRVMGVFDATGVAAMITGALLASLVVEAVSLGASLLLLGGVALAVAVSGLMGLRGLDDIRGRRLDSLATRLRLVAGMPFADSAPPAVLEQLAGAARECSLPRGIDVIVQGAPAHAYYVIVDGGVLVHRDGEPVVRLGPGEGFGERGLLDRAPRNATVTTVADTTLLRIEGQALIEALGAAPGLRSGLNHSNRPFTPSASVTATADVDDLRWGADGTPVVLVIGAGTPGKRRLYERLVALGVRLVVVDEPGHWSSVLAGDGPAEAWLEAAVTGDPDVDAGAVLDAVAAAGVRPAGVLTFWEDSVTVAARVAAALGLPGNPPHAVDAARSKVLTRETSARLGLPTPKAQRVRSLDELYAAAAEIGFPAVVKPEFGALAMGCMRIDDADALPEVYRFVREVVRPETDGIFRAGNDLLLEQYLDGPEFDIDVVLDGGACVFHSVSQELPVPEPVFQAQGMFLPPQHSRREVRELVDLSVSTAQAFGFVTGVLHIEGKCTSDGPRVIEVNARLGGGKVAELVEAVWGVDLVAAQLRSALGRPQDLRPSRRPRCGVVYHLVQPPRSGRLAALDFRAVEAEGPLGVVLEIHSEVGDEVRGPESTTATWVAELAVSGRNLKRARALADHVRRDAVRVHADA